MRIKKLNEDVIVNERKNGDAGIDLSVINIECNLPNRIGGKSVYYDEINSGWYISHEEIYLAHTGISMALGAETFGLIKPRSGISLKYGVNILAGVVDNSYTGEIIVGFTTIKPFFLKKHDRIAQIVPVKFRWNDKIEIVDSLPETERGNNGFGSSGR